MRQIWCAAILGETLREIVWLKQSCFIVQCLIMFLFTIYWFSTQGILLENKSQPTLCLVIILESDPSHGHSESKIFHAFVNHCILKKQNWVLSASHKCQHIIPVAFLWISLCSLWHDRLFPLISENMITKPNAYVKLVSHSFTSTDLQFLNKLGLCTGYSVNECVILV